jgi:hypothetical protein
MRKSKRFVIQHLNTSGTVLDYGCGDGWFLHELVIDMRNRQPHAQVSLLGYDPFMTARKVLTPEGRLLMSIPIEIGPAVLAKEISRCILHRRHLEMSVSELLKAAILGIPARPAEDRKGSHRDFDWRNIRKILAEIFPCEHIEFSPLPMRTWYGQSQVFMVFRSPDNLLST